MLELLHARHGTHGTLMTDDIIVEHVASRIWEAGTIPGHQHALVLLIEHGNASAVLGKLFSIIMGNKALMMMLGIQ